MPPLRAGFPKIVVITLVIILSLAFIFLIYVSNFVIPDQIRSHIGEISKENEYKIEVGDIEFDFFSGLKGSDIKISDPVSLVKPILKIGEIAIQPELLSSLINWKVKIKRVIIDEPVISLTREELDNLMELIGEGGEKEKPIPVEIEHVEIRNAKIKLLPTVFMSSKKIDLDIMGADSEEERTIILYESPHRLEKTLNQMLEFFGEDRKVSVSRELTKIHEETVTGQLKEVINHFEGGKVKGEIVIVIDGKKE